MVYAVRLMQCVLTNIVGFRTVNEIDVLFLRQPIHVVAFQSPATPAARPIAHVI